MTRYSKHKKLAILYGKPSRHKEPLVFGREPSNDKVLKTQETCNTLWETIQTQGTLVRNHPMTRNSNKEPVILGREQPRHKELLVLGREPCNDMEFKHKELAILYGEPSISVFTGSHPMTRSSNTRNLQ